MIAVEKYYTVTETALLLALSNRTVLDKARAKEFGIEVVDLGSTAKPELRIPASGINAYLASRRLFSNLDHSSPGIAARTVGELRRKAAAA